MRPEDEPEPDDVKRAAPRERVQRVHRQRIRGKEREHSSVAEDDYKLEVRRAGDRAQSAGAGLLGNVDRKGAYRKRSPDTTTLPSSTKEVTQTHKTFYAG